MVNSAQWSLMTLCNFTRSLRLFPRQPCSRLSWIYTNVNVMQHQTDLELYMFCGNNPQNHWTWNHSSIAFYDRFYNLQQDNNDNYKMSETSKLPRGENVPKGNHRPNNKLLTITPDGVVDKDSDVGVVFLSSQIGDASGSKRPLSETEADNTNVDDIEIHANETSIRKKHKKHKKHKHSRSDRSKEEASTETEKPDVIRLDDRVVLETIDISSPDKGLSKRFHKHQKHKHKHRRHSKEVEVASAEMEDVVCLDSVELAGTEEKVLHEGDRDQPDREHRRHERKRDNNDYKVISDRSSKRKSPSKREKRKLVKDVVSALDDSGCYTIDLTAESSAIENSGSLVSDSNPQQVVEESVSGSETKEKNIPSLNTTLDSPCDMDIASSPTVGGIYYASELEQDWHKNTQVPPTAGNVHFATDLEKRWQQDSVPDHLQSGILESLPHLQLQSDADFPPLQQWIPVWKSCPQWQYGSAAGIILQTQGSNIQGSLNDLRVQTTRGVHSTVGPWKQDRGQASPQSPPLSTEVTIDMSKPYSGSNGKQF